MVKSGLIVGGGMFLLVLLAAGLSPLFLGGMSLLVLLAAGLNQLFSVCVAVLAGLCAGYLAGVFDKPLTSREAIKKGAIAGAIAAGMGVVAQLITAVINCFILQLQMELQTAEQTIIGVGLWVVQLIMALCVGLLNVGIMAGLGAGGGAIWFSYEGKKNIQAPSQVPFS